MLSSLLSAPRDGGATMRRLYERFGLDITEHHYSELESIDAAVHYTEAHVGA